MWISGRKKSPLSMLDHAVEGEQDMSARGRGKKGVQELKMETHVRTAEEGTGAGN